MSSKHIYGAKPFTGEDSKYHYVYRITNIEENKHYYGVRSCKIDPYNDLGTEYFSSSKSLRPLVKSNTGCFKFKIIKFFDTRKEAAHYEMTLQSKFKVTHSDNFYNNCIHTSTGFDVSGTIWINNGFESKRVKKASPLPEGWKVGSIIKAGKVNKGKIFITDGTCTRKINKGDILPEGWWFGRGPVKFSFRKGFMCINNGLENKKIRSDETIPEGWFKGMINHFDGVSNIGNRVITNGSIDKRIKVDEDIPYGWRLGSCHSNNSCKGKIWITDNINDKLIVPGDVITDGWKRGKANAKTTGTSGMWFITDGVSNKTIPKDSEIPKGWKKGKVRKG